MHSHVRIHLILNRGIEEYKHPNSLIIRILRTAEVLVSPAPQLRHPSLPISFGLNSFTLLLFLFI